MRRLRSLLAPLILALVGFSAPASAQQSQVFQQPAFSGIPVDHCAQFARNCGKGGADQFCQRAGFSAASTWSTYQAGRTYVIGSARECSGGNCTALRDLTCVNTAAYAPIPEAQPTRERRFDNPTASGLPVDHCARFGVFCGRGGANQFCERQGYAFASNWETYQARQTFVIGSNRRCDTGNCTAFSSVTCKPQQAAVAEPVPLPAPSRPYGGEGIQRFDYPSVRGVAIDHCAEFGRNCGRGGANLFCRAEGFSRAASWDTYNAGRTYVAGSQRFCEGSNCTGFTQVTCEAAGYAEPTPEPIRPVNRGERVYPYPRVSGLVVDHCSTFGDNCGRGGADLLCRSQGFDRAARWDTFQAGQTYVLGSRRACTGGNCTGFSSVTCTSGDRVEYEPLPIRPSRPDPIAPRPGPAQTFQNPKFEGLPVDHCATFARNCGRGGAEQFCRSAGFERADNWETYQARRSFVIGSNRECTGGNCTALSQVTCSGSIAYTPSQQPRNDGFVPDPPRNDGEGRRNGNRRGDGEGRNNRNRRSDGERGNRQRNGERGNGQRQQPTGPTRTFAYPQLGGLTVDQCVREGRRCGRGGANRYCKSQGMDKAVSWNTNNPGATVYLGSNERCTGTQCVGLTDVVCQ